MIPRGLQKALCGLLTVVLILGPASVLAQAGSPGSVGAGNPDAVSASHDPHHVSSADSRAGEMHAACSLCDDCDGATHDGPCPHCSTCGHCQVSLTAVTILSLRCHEERLVGITAGPISPIPTRIPRPPRG